MLSQSSGIETTASAKAEVKVHVGCQEVDAVLSRPTLLDSHGHVVREGASPLCGEDKILYSFIEETVAWFMNKNVVTREGSKGYPKSGLK